MGGDWEHLHFCRECYCEVGCSLGCDVEVVDGKAYSGSALCFDCALSERAAEKAASRKADEQALASEWDTGIPP